MVYVTGDCHGDFRRFSTKNFPDQKEMTRDDTVIVCGDFGCIWNGGSEEEWWLKWLSRKKFTFCFVDGNHECLHKETEVLTDKGWVCIKDVYDNVDDYQVASVNLDSHVMSYSKPIGKVKKYADKLLWFDGTNFSQCVTPEHDIILNGKKMKAIDAIGLDIRDKDFRFEVKDVCNSDPVPISNQFVELITAIVMDATIVDYRKYSEASDKVRIQFHLKKQRKISYIQSLLDGCKMSYSLNPQKDGTVFINIYGADARFLYSFFDSDRKQLPSSWRNLDKDQFRFLLKGLVNTDGSSSGSTIVWRTTNKNDIDIVTELCIKHNYDIHVIRLDECASGYHKDYSCSKQYIASIGKEKRIDHRTIIKEIQYDDDVYCLSMLDGTLVTRYNMLPCVTGNCFDRLNSEFPVVDFHGGKAHKIKANVYHLMRGYVFDFDGKKFWCFGGAQSHDIRDGILDLYDFGSAKEFYDAIKQLSLAGKMFRINHVSWWEEELPSEEEMQRGRETLSEYGNKVDYIITHCCPQTVASFIGFRNPDILTQYFNEIAAGTEFKRWIFGHLHRDWYGSTQFQCIYERIERVL